MLGLKLQSNCILIYAYTIVKDYFFKAFIDPIELCQDGFAVL